MVTPPRNGTLGSDDQFLFDDSKLVCGSNFSILGILGQFS
jgi:hypothetical protein